MLGTKKPSSRVRIRFALVFVTSLVVGSSSGDSTFYATTFYANGYCAGTPPMIQYSAIGYSTHQHCVVGVDGDSWTKDAGVTDLYAHAMKQFAGASFLLHSQLDGCDGKPDVWTIARAFAYAASGQCFQYHSENDELVSVLAEISNNKATFRHFADGSCQNETGKVEFIAQSKKTGAGYCMSNGLWQVFDGTGQNWNEKAPVPTEPAPPVPSATTTIPSITNTTTSSPPAEPTPWSSDMENSTTNGLGNDSDATGGWWNSVIGGFINQTHPKTDPPTTSLPTPSSFAATAKMDGVLLFIGVGMMLRC